MRQFDVRQAEEFGISWCASHPFRNSDCTHKKGTAWAMRRTLLRSSVGGKGPAHLAHPPKSGGSYRLDGPHLSFPPRPAASSPPRSSCPRSVSTSAAPSHFCPSPPHFVARPFYCLAASHLLARGSMSTGRKNSLPISVLFSPEGRCKGAKA